MAPEALVHEGNVGFAMRKSEKETITKNESAAANREPDGLSGRKRKITISLSEKSLQALEELRLATDADTDSEVFRNALRLHLTLVRAHTSGVRLFMRREGGEESLPVTLFADVEKDI